ncbi:CHRD domain-containing protein [Streptomyces sp. NBC_00264]|uniref:CHRD domain-containing protein n=1 Tax=unclassified Streptomyces TaxID=2593676 RepID=UPI0022540B24|nr:MULTISPECIES: CHRD domain-containing protein [unclassified Streptomyces]MCX5158921.1 CHRD domain-containing protein [Streptomyces sp. NBC_00305]MCX5217444.1 CHRD domain-containing protein [Streptomyces sp. NBC_00264]
MRRLTVAAAAAVLVAGLTGFAGTTPASAEDGPDAGGSRGAGVSPATAEAAQAPAVSLVARLTGDQDGPTAGDQDGKAVALVKVKGDRVTFALTWNGIGRPTRGHLHRGRPGSDGGVKAELFGTAMPASVNSAAGQTSMSSAVLARQLRTDPGGFYVDLHSEEFPGGAVRGRLRILEKPVNPLSIIRGGKLRALADGGQEVPGDGPGKAGDPDGHSTTFLHPRTDRVDYSMAWVNIGAPLAGHIHEGVLGENGDVRLPLFVSPVPKNVFAISGSVSAPDAEVIARLKGSPTGFYSNVHTREFPDGAVRGQLFR